MNHLMIFLQIEFLTKFFCRKVAMYRMNQIIRTHLIDNSELKPEVDKIGSPPEHLTTASISVRNSLPHVLPGVLLRLISVDHLLMIMFTILI